MHKQHKETNTYRKVVQAILSFKAVALLNILDSNRTYQDVSLYEFMELVVAKLESFKYDGDTQLSLSYDMCNSCNCDQPVAVFTGNRTGNSYALFFEFDNDTITDIYECNWYGDLDDFDNFIDSFNNRDK